MKNKIKLSVVVIARDEEAEIEECLKSVEWADEVLVVDTGSTDNTPEISQRFKARVIKLLFRDYDFSGWRNRGLIEAKNNWIFYLDADERVTPLLKKEILQVINKDTSGVSADFTSEVEYSAYAIPRRNFYLSKEMHYGGSWPDYVIRLFKKSDFEKWQGRLHEQPVYHGRLGKMKNPLVHFTHQDLTSMLNKTINWTKIEADLLFKDNHPPVYWWRILRMMLTKFWERMVKQQAWRDGIEGWINSIFEVFNTFIIYARLWDLQRKKQTASQTDRV